MYSCAVLFIAGQVFHEKSLFVKKAPDESKNREESSGQPPLGSERQR